MRGTKCDLLIVGGGTGGCAAAMAATSLGLHTIMTEPTAWIGGQLTSQAVPPDEHPWIEEFGCTSRYRSYRELVRDYYRHYYPLTEAARSDKHLNPGRGWVSRLCHEPRVGVAVLEQMLAYPRAAGLLDIRTGRTPVAAEMHGRSIRAVSFLNALDGTEETVEARYFVDASELGDLLPMTATGYVVGAESRKETGEEHAVDGPSQPENQQGFTWCFALGFDPNAEHVIEKPDRYDFWRAYAPDFWPGRLLDWTVQDPRTLKPRTWTCFPPEDGGLGLFDYRQILSKDTFAPGMLPEEATIVNWPQNDYWLGPLIDQPEDVVRRSLDDARQLSLSLLYWLQTEAGFPGLHMRPDITNTDDGLAMAPYVRESRRIKAMGTVLEEHVSASQHPGRDRAPSLNDSVGVGCYRIDLHPSTSGEGYLDLSTLPFEIPLGALIPMETENLIPACKNIGTTHITNGCFRLHPVEWNIGESAGSLAAYCVLSKVDQRDVLMNQSHLTEFQRLLERQGIEIHWPPSAPLHAV